MKKLEFSDAIKLKKEGYNFLGTDFCEKKNGNFLILYPFKNEEAAKKFSRTDSETEPFIIEINEELKKLPEKVLNIKIYIELP